MRNCAGRRDVKQKCRPRDYACKRDMGFHPMRHMAENNDFLNMRTLLVLVISILCLVPFLTKAFHIDDTLFLFIARQIHVDPMDFYGSAVNWNGAEEPVSVINKNPPAVSYFIALVTWILGWGEIPLHLAFLMPAAGFSLGTYCLARMLCTRPHLAAVTAALTPAFLVSSTNVMSDVMMMAFYVWAAALWLLGLERGRRLYFVCSAACIALSALTKYYGISLVPLLAVFTLVKKRKLGSWVLYLALPILILAVYEWITYAQYGQGLLSSAASFALTARYEGKAALLMKTLTLLAFTGGCLASSAFYSPFLWSARSWAIAVWLASTLIIFFLTMSEVGGVLRDADGVRWGLITQFIFFILAGIHILALAIADLWTNRDSPALLLFLWILGAFFFAGFVNWMINARVLLPMAPAMGILIMRRFEQRAETRGPRRRQALVWPLIPAACLALLVTWADFRQANANRSAARIIHAEYKDFAHTLWFQGHWGFQYYMESLGAKALDLKNSWLEPGDVVVVPTSNSGLFKPRQGKFPFPPERLDVAGCGWLGTMNADLGAGFYSDRWGPLPFAFGLVPPEEFLFLEIHRSVKDVYHVRPARHWFTTSND